MVKLVCAHFYRVYQEFNGSDNMKLKPYLKYKDPGIKWIGEIPEDWEVHRLKFLLSSLESGSRETGGGNQLDEGIFSLGGEHINWDGTLNLENSKLISEEYYNSMNQGKIKINDVLLVKDGATIGKTAILIKKEFKKIAVNEHVFLIRSNKRIDPKLLYYLICGDSGFKQIKLTEVGSAQGGINQDFIAKVYFSIPKDKQEQTTITNFLDSKTAKIDALVEKDKILIELLKEKRAALINHAVTKGLNPNVKMKDSGIDWIGEIPEGWEIHRLKSFIPYIINGQWGEEPNGDGFDMIVLRVADFGEFNFNLVKELTLRSVKDPKLRIRDGDLVIEKSGGGEKQLVGRVIQLKNISKQKKYTYSNFLGKLIIKETISKDYLKYYFKAFYNARVNYRYIKQTTGIQNLDIMALLQKEFFAFPQNKQQQTAIANYLDKATAKIDKTIQKIEQKIKLLEEYKKSLIHHTVTGKIDVRGLEY